MNRLPGGLVQPDARSCGAASMVAARMVVDPAYADLVTSGRSGRDFGTETLSMHRRITGLATLGGGAQLPWPRAIGTPPWAVAHQLSATAGPGRPSTTYRWRTVRLDPTTTAQRIRDGLGLDRPVALFVGDRWLPRHVVLAVGAAGDAIGCYDPARGRTIAVRGDAFAAARLPFGRWTHAWFVVEPATAARPSSRRTSA